MPFKWDTDAEHKMLVYIVKHFDVKPPQDMFEGVATAIGQGVNANACSQKYYKLKREADKLLGQAGGDSAAAATPASTKKTPSKAKPTPKSTSGRKRKVDVDLDEDEVPETPTKKSKKQAKEEEAEEDINEEGKD